jgi:hypothetical protein
MEIVLWTDDMDPALARLVGYHECSPSPTTGWTPADDLRCRPDDNFIELVQRHSSCPLGRTFATSTRLSLISRSERPHVPLSRSGRSTGVSPRITGSRVVVAAFHNWRTG